MTKFLALALLIIISFNAYCQNDKQKIEQVLDIFHQAAADANQKVYLESMTDNAVFLGTDASERWTKLQFSAFVKPYFSKGKGWLYTPVERNITLVTGQNSAYFDELLDSASYGKCRGTGLLLKTKLGWKIAQYSLSVPLPNPIAKDLVREIKKFEEKGSE
jgi:hypothetical protein